MKEHPILFSAPMALAILEGRKSVTRRVVMPQPPSVDAVRARTGDSYHLFSDKHRPGDIWRVAGGVSAVKELCGQSEWRCPCGQPGDRLWVREEHYRFGYWEEVPGKLTRGGRQKWRFVACKDEVLFEPPTVYRKARSRSDPTEPCWHKRLARFMPRSVSRLTLEVTEVRVQRLQEISEADARVEGPPLWIEEAGARTERNPKTAFRILWDSINGAGAWEKNPWVWAISFRRVP